MSDPNRESDRQQESPLGADDIYRKLEERAIAESNGLNQRVAHCQKCRGKEFLPVVGSGHPYGDVLLLKYQPRYLEVSEGVVFFGRGGGAILKSVQRLGVDPLLLYGTNIVKCPEIDPVSYTHLRAHETDSYLVCRLLLEKKKKNKKNNR